jgi:putative transposase
LSSSIRGYCPAFPCRFGSIADARAFKPTVFQYYNHEHRHSGIGSHPDRFHRAPTPPELPTAAWIMNHRRTTRR